MLDGASAPKAILKSLRQVVRYDAAALYLVNRATQALEHLLRSERSLAIQILIPRDLAVAVRSAQDVLIAVAVEVSGVHRLDARR